MRRTRRLPIKGDVLVAVGDKVEPGTAVARALLPGALQTIKLAEKLGIEPQDVKSMFQLPIGAPIARGQVIAETKGFFGLGKQKIESEVVGTVEAISEVSGHVLVREASIPVEINAYIQGVVAETMPGEGAVIETRGAMVQGIFGVGGERTGSIRVAVNGPGDVLDVANISESDAGKILVGGSGVTAAAIKKASDLGITGLIVGGIKDSDLTQFLGYDIGVAITGTENINLTIMVTEGFGFLAMAARTFDLLKEFEGTMASINGATQIRAGVIRPEIIIPHARGASSSTGGSGVFELTPGTPIRVIREPYFGLLGSVTELPPTLVTLESGTEVRVLRAKLSDGRDVTVPRANVEIVAGA